MGPDESGGTLEISSGANEDKTMNDEPTAEEEMAMNANDHELRSMFNSGNRAQALAAKREAEMRGVRLPEEL